MHMHRCTRIEDFIGRAADKAEHVMEGSTSGIQKIASDGYPSRSKRAAPQI
jgi:hypothetical protein